MRESAERNDLMEHQRHRSEDIIINAPMSFAGAAQRSWRLRRTGPQWFGLTVMTLVALLVIAAWWATVAVWYVIIFGLLGILALPYRFLRRGARKRKMEARRHREMMDALERKR